MMEQCASAECPLQPLAGASSTSASASTISLPPGDRELSLFQLQQSGDSGRCSAFETPATRAMQWFSPATTATVSRAPAPLLDLSDPFAATTSFGSALHWTPLCSTSSSAADPAAEWESGLFAALSPPTALTSYPLLWTQQHQQHYTYLQPLVAPPEHMLHSTPVTSTCAAETAFGGSSQYRSWLTPPPPLPSPPVAFCLAAATLQTARNAIPLAVSAQLPRPAMRPLANRSAERASATAVVEEVPPNRDMGPTSSHHIHVPLQKTRGRARTTTAAPAAKRARHSSDSSGDTSNDSRLRTTFSRAAIAVLNEWCALLES